MANKPMCGKCFPKEVCMCNKTKPLDLTKPVQTRYGHKARIICTDRKDPFPVVALVQNGYEELLTYRLDGSYTGPGSGSHKDLINVPEKKKEKFFLIIPKASCNGKTYCVSELTWLSLSSNTRDVYTVIGEHTFEWEE